MNLTKKKNEVKNGWTKDKSVPVGDRDLGHFFGMTEIRDATASKKTKLLTLRG